MKTKKNWPQKLQLAVWIFFSAAPTAQNSPELKIHKRNVAQIPLSTTLFLTHLINSSFYHLFFSVLTFLCQSLFFLFLQKSYIKRLFLKYVQ